jgi:hypothetical protein
MNEESFQAGRHKTLSLGIVYFQFHQIYVRGGRHEHELEGWQKLCPCLTQLLLSECAVYAAKVSRTISKWGGRKQSGETKNFAQRVHSQDRRCLVQDSPLEHPETEAEILNFVQTRSSQ